MSDVLEKGRKAVEDYGDRALVGRKNAYECDASGSFGNQGNGCGAYIVTIDVHVGVTPFMLKCGRCEGFAHSKMYRVQPDLVPTHEWYRPETIDGIDPAYFHHLENGGLILRPVEGGKDEWLMPRAPLLDQMEHFARMKREADAAFATMDKAEMLTRQQIRQTERKKGRCGD